MRMWPEQAAHFLGHFEGLSKVHPHLEKRRVPVGPDGFGCFQAQTAPLARLYLPAREAPKICMTRLGLGEAVMALVEHSFMLGVPEALGLEAARFRLFAEVARQVPVSRLAYPDGMDHLPRVRAAVLADLAES